MGRIKILYFHHGGGKGGAPNSLLFLLKNLDRERFEPEVACGFAEPYAKSFFEEHGLDPIDIPVARFSHVYPSGWWPLHNPRGLSRLLKWIFIRNPRSAKRFAQVLDDVKPDIVHLNSLTIAPLARVAKKKGFLVVLHVRESASIKGYFGVRWRWLRWLATRYADHVVYICKDNQDQLTGPIESSTVIYNPVPFNQFDRELDGVKLREELGISANATVLFFPGGSSSPPKGIYPFLDALAEIQKQGSDVVAIIPGIEEPPRRRGDFTRKRVERIIKEHGIESAIARLPFSGSVQQYFAVSDVIVTPFTVPHFSRAAIEAGAMAKPVIGSRIGGVEEVIKDGVTGLLVNPGDAQDLAEKLIQLIRDPEQRKQMGEAAYQVASETYRAENHATAVMKVYEQVLAT